MKTRLIMAVSLLMTAHVLAQADTMPLGYCNVNENPTGVLSDNTNGAWSSGAIYIPASTAATIAGNKITGIKFGIQLMLNVESAKVWVRTSLDGDNLAEQTLDAGSEPKLARGWNEAVFEQPWTVPDDCGGFYLGYSVLQKGYCYGLANSPAPCVNGLFANLGDNGWEDMSDQGTLYLQALVEGDDLPAVNLGIASCNLDDRVYLHKGTVSGELRVHNLGAAGVNSFDVAMYHEGKLLGTSPVTTDLMPGASQEYKVDFNPTFDTAGLYDIELRINNVDAGVDVDPLDNTVVQPVHVMEREPERVMLVEEFSTEGCNNCPAAASLLHSLMQQERYADRIAAVVHHAGYGTDMYTQAWDLEYEWFYNGGLFAPAFMVDRNSINGARPIIGAGDLEATLADRVDDRPVMMLDMTAGFEDEAGSTLTVTVRGTKYTRDPVCENPHITLWLTENNVKAVSQAGAPGNYRHQHLARAVNATWGEPVIFDGDTFEYKYVFEDINPVWKQADFVVVGAVHNAKGQSYSDCRIVNACFTRYEDFKEISGVESVDAARETDIDAVYYTLSGIRVNSDTLAPGVYIRRCGNEVTKITVR